MEARHLQLVTSISRQLSRSSEWDLARQVAAALRGDWCAFVGGPRNTGRRPELKQSSPDQAAQMRRLVSQRAHQADGPEIVAVAATLLAWEQGVRGSYGDWLKVISYHQGHIDEEVVLHLNVLNTLGHEVQSSEHPMDQRELMWSVEQLMRDMDLSAVWLMLRWANPHEPMEMLRDAFWLREQAAASGIWDLTVEITRSGQLPDGVVASDLLTISRAIMA